MKILFIGPNKGIIKSWGHELFKREISRQHNVEFYGPDYPNFYNIKYIPKIIKNFRKKNKEFDLIMTYESKWTKDFNGFQDIKIPKVHIAIDYVKPRSNFDNFSNWNNVNKLLKINQPDLIFAVTTRAVNDLKTNLKFNNVYFLPFSVDINVYKNLNLNKTIEVFAVFSAFPNVYPLREEMRKEVENMHINIFSKKVIHNRYIEKINTSKIFINSNNLNNSLSMKYTESLACGTFFLTNKPDDFELLGYKNKKHLVLFNDIKDFKDKVKYYLKNDTEREFIAKQGMKFVRKNHTCEIRVKQMTKYIHEVLGI